MELEDFRGIHSGQDVICIGNGPSLESVSVEFLRSRPSFGLNFIVQHNEHLDGFVPTYWVGLDFGGVEAIRGLPPAMPKFTSKDQYPLLKGKGIPTENVIPFESRDLERPKKGLFYGTSLIAAAHLASILMGASRVLLVGFDCTRGKRLIRYGNGMTTMPHFYDPMHRAQPTMSWCKEFRKLDIWLRRRGQKIVNLSHPTVCKYLEQDYFWRLDEHQETGTSEATGV
jgi:hypothetical protein